LNPQNPDIRLRRNLSFFNLKAFIHLEAPRAACEVNKMILLWVKLGAMTLRLCFAFDVYTLQCLAVTLYNRFVYKDIDVVYKPGRANA
jgi:hypothetical protein